MRIVLLAILLGSSSLLAADRHDQPPQDAIKVDGALALYDGSSYFVFLRDGTFRSFPRGMSGRCLEGTFKSDGTRFTVTAKETWMNGASASPAHDDYRKVIFIVYPGESKPNDVADRGGGETPPKTLWSGYYIIDEFTKIQKPNE